MSELRDLTGAFRAFDKRLTSVEELLLVIVRNSEQESEWRHEQRNRAQITDSERAETERLSALAIKQVQEACGGISHKLAEVVERLDNQASTRLSDVKELRDRVRQLELDRVSVDEITQS
jgi:hypothetical protein